MRINPTACRRGGTITLGSSQMNLTSFDGRCTHDAEFPFYNPLTDNTMASKMCAYGEVGQGTIIMGASGSYVKWLASFLGDYDYPHPTPEGDLGNGGDWAGISYVVSCTVDARDVWEYRTVTLTLQDPETSDPSYARSLQGDEPRDPIPWTSAINECLIGSSVAANWQILDQNAGQDGLLDLLSDLTDNWRPPPYGFNNSINALEDALGLVSALVISRINSSTVAVAGTVVITTTTAGSRKWFAWLFIIPPVGVTVLLSCLIITNRGLQGVPESLDARYFLKQSERLRRGDIEHGDGEPTTEGGAGGAATDGEPATEGGGAATKVGAATDGEPVTEGGGAATEVGAATDGEPATEGGGAETETELETEIRQETESDQVSLLPSAAPLGQSPSGQC
jgi:hypothetical protein